MSLWWVGVWCQKGVSCLRPHYSCQRLRVSAGCQMSSWKAPYPSLRLLHHRFCLSKYTNPKISPIIASSVLGVLPFGAIESIYWCPQPESQQSLLMLQPTKLSEAQLAVFSKHLRFSHVHLKSTLLLRLLLQRHVSPLKLFLLFL